LLKVLTDKGVSENTDNLYDVNYKSEFSSGIHCTYHSYRAFKRN